MRDMQKEVLVQNFNFVEMRLWDKKFLQFNSSKNYILTNVKYFWKKISVIDVMCVSQIKSYNNKFWGS